MEANKDVGQLAPVTAERQSTVMLTKDSSEDELRRYFEGILNLAKTQEEFPVNLDEVWMLVYSKKSDAVSALKRKAEFVEGVDYQVLRQNPQNPLGGRPTTDYFLSVSCLEYFIARKVRPVFDVYRKVFHGTAKVIAEAKARSEAQEMLPKDYISALRALADSEEKKQRLALESKQKQEVIEKQQPYVDFAKEAFLSTTEVDIGQAAKILELPYGRNTLFENLRKAGVFFSDRNEPKQKFINAGYFKLKQLRPFYTSDGTPIIKFKVLCTQKGLAYINYLFGSKTELSFYRSKSNIK